MLITDKIIGAGSHRGDMSITSLEFSPEVEEIGYGAFFECKNLEKVIIPKTVKVVREGAFASCSNLKDLTFDYSTTFETEVFNRCFNLSYMHNQGITARVFSLDNVDAYIVALYNKELSTQNCKIYVGRYDNTEGGFPTEKVDTSQPLIYVAVIEKDGVEYKWFHEDLQTAVAVATFLSSDKSFGEFFHLNLSEDLEINKKQFALLIGACATAYNFWDYVTEACSLDPEGKYQIGLIFNILGDDIPYITGKLHAMIEHKNEHFSFFDMKNITAFHIATAEFKTWWKHHCYREG